VDKQNLRLGVFHPLKLAYVSNNKVASTTIEHILKNELKKYTGELHGDKIYESKKLTCSQLNDYVEENKLFVFTFVRNPYDRVISAYHYRISHYAKCFEKYIYFCVKVNQFISGPHAWNSYRYKNDYAAALIPFDKFIAGLRKNGTDFDLHFREQSAVIDFDNIKYNHIGKIEKFSDDLIYILNKVGFNENNKICEFCDIRKNRTPNRKSIDKYLNEKNKREIYEIYRSDFLHFYYSR